MIGLNANGNHIKRDAVITGLLIFTLDVFNALPEGDIPTLPHVYKAIRLGVISAVTFYLANRGIKAYHNKGEK